MTARLTSKEDLLRLWKTNVGLQIFFDPKLNTENAIHRKHATDLLSCKCGIFAVPDIHQ